MTDLLGNKLVLGVLIPAVNTVVEPEFSGLRPAGVTNQTARFALPDVRGYGGGRAGAMAGDVAAAIGIAVDILCACDPDAIALAYSTEYLPGGRASAEAVHEAVAARAKGVAVTSAAFAVPRALERLGAKRIGVVTPYLPHENANVRACFEESGYSVKAVEGAHRDSGTRAATTGSEAIRAAFAAVDGGDVDALIHVGSNLPVLDICVDLEKALGKPVFGANQATYWAALRDNGVADRLEGFGRLLAEF